MLGLVYLHYKFLPSDGGLTLALFLVLAGAFLAGSLVSMWILATRWRRLSPSMRLAFIFYAVLA
jgi:hypothetical protein